MLAVDGVKEAVCFGVPDDHFGEIVWAAVVLSKDGAQETEEARIKKALDGKIAKVRLSDIFITYKLSWFNSIHSSRYRSESLL